MGKSICPSCKNLCNDSFSLEYTMFKHIDFSEFIQANGQNALVECERCSHVSRIINKNHAHQIKNIYNSSEYADHSEMRNVRYEEKTLPAAKVQADIIFKNLLPSKPLSILDIGCFDGALLGELENITKTDLLVGLDLHERPSFSKNCSGHFTSVSLEEIQGEFDLITASQSLIYIEDLVLFFTEVDRLLTPEGHLFIHVPNVEQRPNLLLLGDQYHYFSQYSLLSAFIHAGFKAKLIKNCAFPKDLLFIAKKGLSKKIQPRPFLQNSISKLMHQHKIYLQFKKKYDKISILGTTMEAAFAYSLLHSHVESFADEDSNKIGKTFHGKPVIHPSQLNPQNKCLLPYDSNYSDLCKRMNNEYAAEFFLAN